MSAESPPASPEEAVAGAVTEAEQEAAVEATVGETIDIVTPAGGESVTEGTILEWSVKVGDTVKDGDTVVEISTDKVDMELPAPTSGTITEILAEDGDTVTVGQVIARMTKSAGGASAPASSTPAATTEPVPVVPAGDGANISPVARRVAASEGIDLGGVVGSARGGRITKADVLAAAGNGAAATAEPQKAAPERAAPIKTSRSGVAPRHSPATWTRAARSRPPPRSGR